MRPLVDSVPRHLGAAAPRLLSRAGVGLKSVHFREIVETGPDLGFFEVHAENYMVEGGLFHHCLSRIRESYPLSVRGVGLSIGAQEIHLAGFAEQQDGHGDPLLIDSHSSAVAQTVWDLYAFTLGLTGAVATLIERDNDIPALPVLVAEAAAAEQRLRALPAATGDGLAVTGVEVVA